MGQFLASRSFSRVIGPVEVGGKSARLNGLRCRAVQEGDFSDHAEGTSRFSSGACWRALSATRFRGRLRWEWRCKEKVAGSPVLLELGHSVGLDARSGALRIQGCCRFTGLALAPRPLEQNSL